MVVTFYRRHSAFHSPNAFFAPKRSCLFLVRQPLCIFRDGCLLVRQPLLMWNDSRNDTIPGYRFAIRLSFCNGCIWVQPGCCRVQTEARWVQHRAFVLLFTGSPTFTLCQALGLSGAVSSTMSQNPKRAANRVLCGYKITVVSKLDRSPTLQPKLSQNPYIFLSIHWHHVTQHFVFYFWSPINL